MSAIDLVFLGDIILDVADPDHWLSGIADITRTADVAIGHLEVPHTRRGTELVGDVPAPGADPDNLAALSRAGIAALSMAGNHIADCGAEGISDTCAALDRLGIVHTGAGATLADAKRPVWLERDGRRIVLLSYNCVGPEISWATADRAGSAYVAVRPPDGGPARPQAELVDIDNASCADMAADIAAVREPDTLVVVALHKGITHRPAELARYERPLTHAAIDAGADVVVGHHAHIVRGIELYRNRPIYHGLGNGVVVTHALSPGQDHAARAEWVERRKRMFGFEPDPAYTLAPFHPEAVNGMIGAVRWLSSGKLDIGYYPVFFEAPGRPILATTAQAAEIAQYIERIGVQAGLPLMPMEEDGLRRVYVP
jgi:poly-gamma-glutamate capsule biosynthesis protein CapA/YwtB (metallophosphatase superfamily)